MRGRENVPQAGACIFCPNHVSNFDPVLIAMYAGTRHVRFLAKAELFEKKFVAKLIRALGAFPIHRGQRDMAAMRECFALLKDGHALGVFPQGTRSSVENPHPFENGAALIALRARVPVIPVYVGGKIGIGHVVDLRFGAPVPLDDLYGKLDAASLDEATRRTERAVWALR